MKIQGLNRDDLEWIDKAFRHLMSAQAKQIKGAGIDGWDPLDDPLTMFSPEFLVFVLMRAKEFYKEEGIKC